MELAIERARQPAEWNPDRLDARDPDRVRRILPWVQRFNRHYIRLRVLGREHIRAGPALFVGNHNSGIVGPDLLATLGTLWSELGPEAPIYGLAHDYAMRQLPVVGRLIQRLGAVRACRDNARRILEAGGVALAYPGGVLDAFRASWRQNEVVLERRDGFVRVARETGAPIVPVVAHGAHRSALILSEGARLASALGLERLRQERFPLALALPWGVALGPWLPYLPLPLSVRLRFLPPISVKRSDDPLVVQMRVRSAMQRALDELGAAP
jgi:1-acyl-sn-glycerol-3-phosphate acyltransferase